MNYCPITDPHNYQQILRNMTSAFNEFSRGSSMRDIEMTAGPELFSLYEMNTQIIQRFVPVDRPNDGHPVMAFRSGRLRNSLDQQSPWRFTISNGTRWVSIGDIRNYV